MSFRVETDVMVPMADGTKLATDIWLPEGDGPFPVLLTRTPYGKHELLSAYSLTNPLVFPVVEAGYAIVFQEARGTGRSDGEYFLPHVDDRGDGADTVNWIAEQEWCDGNVGTFGLSYLGLDQWATASAAPPALKAMVPSFGPSDPYQVWNGLGGVMQLGLTLGWYPGNAVFQLMRKIGRGEADPAQLANLAEIAPNIGLPLDQGPFFRQTPVQDKPAVIEYMPFLADVFEHPARDDFWKELSARERMDKITAPALTITGWYDWFYHANIADFQAAKAGAGSQEARDGQRLIIGPWAHDARGFDANWPDRFFPGGTLHAIGFTQTQLAFFDYHLRGNKDALDAMAPVRIYVMGIDEWRDEQDWPLPDTKYVEYHLGGDGAANTSGGAGTLATEAPASDATDTYLYDPLRPVPTTQTTPPAQLEPSDQSPIEARDDVLCFSTPVLDTAVEVTGPIELTLFVSSSAVDTDFTAQLVDVHPDGRAILLSEGVLRMRYRRSHEEPELMTPGEIYEAKIDVGATANVFLPGHRIRLEVSSSNFPRYDRNGNTGGKISAEREADMIVAINNIHRGPTHPSRLTLPIIER